MDEQILLVMFVFLVLLEGVTRTVQVPPGRAHGVFSGWQVSHDMGFRGKMVRQEAEYCCKLVYAQGGNRPTIARAGDESHALNKVVD